MLLFIEGYPYNLNTIVRTDHSVRDILADVVTIPAKEESYTPEYVGYCYSKAAKDVVFFLPKVVLTGDQNEENYTDTIFGASPQDIIDFDSDSVKTKFTEEGCKQYKEFLSTLSIWIYRAISVYKQNNNANILESKDYNTESKGRKQKHNTLLDVIIALRDFNKNNQDYFTFIAKNVHSGYNKIQWQNTITKSDSIITKGTPIYIDPINKKNAINFDEELLVIYFSILNYIKETHGFSFDINIAYPLINPEKLKNSYIGHNLGCRRLRQIKYKYFADKALRIWDLCYAFFDREYKIAMNKQTEDYLLAKGFEHIFETMIDCLIGGNDKKFLPKELTDQKDGKLVDHLFIGQGLIEQSNLPSELTYYIGDSKYYKRSKNDTTELGDRSIYKQYTYAKNVIQWNMNLFLDNGDSNTQPQLRDALTEGYNPIPNFFISAKIPSKRESQEKFLSFDESGLKAQEGQVKLNRQFENRLFDRDTLLLCHYDVNFLYIVSLYGRDKKSKQSIWRESVRQEFRKRIQDTLNTLYSFRILYPREGKDCYKFIKDNFHQLNGKLYRSKADKNYLVLALMKGDEQGKDQWSKLKIQPTIVEKEVLSNNDLLSSLQSHFEVSDSFELTNELNVQPIPNMGVLSPLPNKIGSDGVLMVMMEEYETKCKNFTDGKIAIGIKLTNESMPILENLQEIGYILFHKRKDEEQHLFALTANCSVLPKESDALKGVYQNISTANLYVLVKFNPSAELDSTSLHSSKAPWTKQTRYDAQYCILHELIVSTNNYE